MLYESEDQYKRDSKMYLIEYGTMMATYDFIEDIGLDKEIYTKYLSKACDSALRLLRYAPHYTKEQKEDMEPLLLEAYRELIEEDFGKGIEDIA